MTGKERTAHSTAATVAKASALRRNPTDAEKKLWTALRRRQLDGHFFRQQAPVGPYIVDLVCKKSRLVIEVDGGQHALQAAHDETRTIFLRQQGYEVLRFWNNEVFENLEGVLETIRTKLDGPKTPPPRPSPPPQKGGGGASWASSRPPRTRGAPRRRVRQGHPGKPRTRRSSAPPTRSPRAGLPPQRPARPREAVKACQKLGQVILSWLDHNAARCDWAETKHPLPSLPLNKGEGPKCVPPSSLGRVREGVFCLPRTRTALARISPRAHIPGRATGDFHWLWSPLNWLRSRNNMASLDDKLALFWRVRRAQVVDMNWIAQNGIGFASQECEWAGNHA